MTPLFQKLNLGQHRNLLVLQAPTSFETHLKDLSEGLPSLNIHRALPAGQTAEFFLAFVQTLTAIQEATLLLPRIPGDGVVWFAYPKATSKTLRCEFNRDTGWSALGDAGFEGVRQVAIDADWSALRFRRVEFIKRMQRDESRSLTAAGKARTRKAQP
jgi:hypothetical protein